MDSDQAHKHLSEYLRLDAGRFYAEGSSLSLGVGQIYSDVIFPLFNNLEKIFVTGVGLAFILTHECDIDQANRRPFNTHLLVCPIIDFRDFVAEFQNEHPDHEFISFLACLGRREVSRLIYIPHFTSHLPYGGLLYLNQITHTHVDIFNNNSAQRVCTVTNYGLREVDHALINHLLRPKVESLPL